MFLHRSLSVIKLGARAALVLAALVGSADLASRAAFTERPLQGRIEGFLRRTPHRSMVNEEVSVERVRPARNHHQS